MKKVILSLSIMGAVMAVGASGVSAKSCASDATDCFSMPVPEPETPGQNTGTVEPPAEPVIEDPVIEEEGSTTPPATPDSDSGSTDIGSPEPVEPPPATPDADSSTTGTENVGSAPDADQSVSENSGADTATGETLPPAAPDTESAPVEAVIEAPAPQPVAQPAVVEVTQVVNHPLTGATGTSPQPVITAIAVDTAVVQMDSTAQITDQGSNISVNGFALKLALTVPAVVALAALAAVATRTKKLETPNAETTPDTDSITDVVEAEEQVLNIDQFDFDAELAQLLAEEELTTV